MKPWIALFSQTGTEIYKLIQQTGHVPVKVLTNRQPDCLEGVNASLLASYGHLITYLPFKPRSEDYFEAVGDVDVVITLHGFLRILPVDVCEKYLIFNGHPALITKYPELKGFSRQRDAFYSREEYPTIGTVIHRVGAELDAGEVFLSNEEVNAVTSLEDAYTTLYRMSFDLWLTFFKEYVCLSV